MLIKTFKAISTTIIFTLFSGLSHAALSLSSLDYYYSNQTTGDRKGLHINVLFDENVLYEAGEYNSYSVAINQVSINGVESGSVDFVNFFMAVYDEPDYFRIFFENFSASGTGTFGNWTAYSDSIWSPEWGVGYFNSYNLNYNYVSEVPLPAAFWIYGSGLIGLAFRKIILSRPV